MSMLKKDIPLITEEELRECNYSTDELIDIAIEEFDRLSSEIDEDDEP